MRQILALLMVFFVFWGCAPKKVVEIKLPAKTQKVAEKPKDEDSVSVVEEFVPVDIKESDNKIKEVTPLPSQKKDLKSSQKINLNEEPTNFVEPVSNNQAVVVQIDETKAKNKIAFVYPSRLVEKYAKSSINTISGYLSYQKAEYDLVVIDCENESSDNILNAFSQVSQEGATKVIGLFTPSALPVLNRVVSSDLKVYLPLVEKKDSPESNNSLIFGSISYDDQLKKLSYYSTGKNAMFYQDTYLSSKLKRSFDNLVGVADIQKEVKKDEINFKGIVNDGRLNNASLFLNTDLVKSSLIMSQLVSFDIYPKIIFSTQVNYDQALFTLTQPKDRQRLVVASSIDTVDAKLKDTISNAGGNIVYEWVDYSTLVGINYLYNGGNSSIVPTQVSNNQAIYTPRLYKATEIGFTEIK